MKQLATGTEGSSKICMKSQKIIDDIVKNTAHKHWNSHSVDSWIISAVWDWDKIVEQDIVEALTMINVCLVMNMEMTP